jgi:hypothetical protein
MPWQRLPRKRAGFLQPGFAWYTVGWKNKKHLIIRRRPPNGEVFLYRNEALIYFVAVGGSALPDAVG